MNNRHISRIDLNLLVVLDAICAEGSITRASEKLNLTQSAISHALTRLRMLFDDPLFVREGRTIVPTPLARSLTEPIRRSLRGIEITLNEAGRFEPSSTRRRFTIAVRGMLELMLLPPLLQYISGRAPGVDIAAVSVNRRDLEQELETGAIDAAIDAPLPVSPNVRRTAIPVGAMVVVARQDHPHIQGELTLATYMRQGHILVSTRRRGPGLQDLELGRHDLHRRVRLRCQDYFTACSVVSRTDLLLTMPERHAETFNRPFDNCIYALPFSMPDIEAYYYWHNSSTNDPANCWLREQVAEALRQA
ncbi:LysR family transcriptional regulator [Herbaspirillum sp. ST 5-3]|uniref:LysR family transcriptional regulator n=1 Tax=Oxalobacteraceae TaxID=75682 RepID=UPI0010A4CAA4|nr:LysR family transcriptional regulator [Herbaspirillum sp. ST 5-3]